MSNVFKDVLDFHSAFGLNIGTHPQIPEDINERTLRMDLLEEEYNEYLEAEEKADIVGIADALGDMIYIICGTAASYGIPLQEVFEEIHRSNMAKLVDGKVIRRADGKVLKPEGWKPPNIEYILKKHNVGGNI